MLIRTQETFDPVLPELEINLERNLTSICLFRHSLGLSEPGNAESRLCSTSEVHFLPVVEESQSERHKTVNQRAQCFLQATNNIPVKFSSSVACLL